ncbi:hypothetical protein NQ314_013964 [Rhamnusium bicolor]|uniref:Uncharacterized protein n=1 Tax=Rhamnusium bicolor TaxID=1586634 RepID=A0AAV8X449_9CUCU|nr:hypothetical protein NQ314_013964 [Rhamnusium bicolor]
MLSVTKKNFSVRSLREHLELLIKLWLKEFKTLKNLSGIEVTNTEKDTLCESIYALKCSQEKEKNVKRNIRISRKKGLEARDKFASSSNDYGQEYESSEDAPLLDFQDLAFIEEGYKKYFFKAFNQVSLNYKPVTNFKSIFF